MPPETAPKLAPDAPATNAALLVELFTEELPPKALKRLGDAFCAGLVEGLRSRGLAGADAKVDGFATPRRLAVRIATVASQAPDRSVEVKGPSAATKVSAVHVMDKSLMAMIEGDAPAGSYTVSWQSAGGDGHFQKGEFAFTLKK